MKLFYDHDTLGLDQVVYDNDVLGLDQIVDVCMVVIDGLVVLIVQWIYWLYYVDWLMNQLFYFDWLTNVLKHLLFVRV